MKYTHNTIIVRSLIMSLSMIIVGVCLLCPLCFIIPATDNFALLIFPAMFFIVGMLFYAIAWTAKTSNELGNLGVPNPIKWVKGFAGFIKGFGNASKKIYVAINKDWEG